MTLRLRSLKRRFAETSTLFSSARQSERLAYTPQHRSGDPAIRFSGRFQNIEKRDSPIPFLRMDGLDDNSLAP